MKMKMRPTKNYFLIGLFLYSFASLLFDCLDDN